jgi:hypothetical protein
VDDSDLAVFLSAGSSRSGEPEYLPFLDFDDNGRINRRDFDPFSRRLGRSL